ncbi:type II toxin-antitoxin system RelE/ParE family toxin [Nemorincola caseinilytica]|uniref:Type II toxin-antitoxin system RelE/ParE family toxin n=1 Tax=Nemorincola caseinilytica TaxID=2054315 RepID=A0ABP8N803_9BACT
MKRYEIVFSKRAEKDIEKLPAKVVEKIIPEIVALEEDPRPPGCKKLKGFADLWRIRVGNYRVIYVIEDRILLVDIREIGNRKNIYG